jgi:hypothetical protein
MIPIDTSMILQKKVATTMFAIATFLHLEILYQAGKYCSFGRNARPVMTVFVSIASCIL